MHNSLAYFFVFLSCPNVLWCKPFAPAHLPAASDFLPDLAGGQRALNLNWLPLNFQEITFFDTHSTSTELESASTKMWKYVPCLSLIPQFSKIPFLSFGIDSQLDILEISHFPTCYHLSKVHYNNINNIYWVSIFNCLPRFYILWLADTRNYVFLINFSDMCSHRFVLLSMIW